MPQLTISFDYKVLEFFADKHREETERAKAERRPPPKFNDTVRRWLNKWVDQETAATER